MMSTTLRSPADGIAVGDRVRFYIGDYWKDGEGYPGVVTALVDEAPPFRQGVRVLVDEPGVALASPPEMVREFVTDATWLMVEGERTGDGVG